MLIELLQLFFICLSFFTLLIIIIIQFYRIVRKKIIFELFIIEYIKFYFLVINIIFIFLIYSYLISDFSIINIIENSHENIPILYKLSGLWSNHEGSIFLWLWVLSLYSFFLSLFLSDWLILFKLTLQMHTSDSLDISELGETFLKTNERNNNYIKPMDSAYVNRSYGILNWY